jgi:hypothetical protein
MTNTFAGDRFAISLNFSSDKLKMNELKSVAMKTVTVTVY